MKLAIFACCALGIALSASAQAAEISTHVLDLKSGIGGEGVPVRLEKKSQDNSWVEVATEQTGENGRVKSFGDSSQFNEGIYKLVFDMTAYKAGEAKPFFPEINLVFEITDAAAHYHVPVVVSPYGYSTYRGN